MAARGQQIPILIHEQNAVLGRVNRTMAKSAGIVACGFERLDRLPREALARKRVVGNPVRSPILAVRERPYPEAAAGARLNILAIGGSQGARLFGEVIPAAIALLPKDLRARLDVVQQVREEQLAAARKAYDAAKVKAEIAPFFSDMGQKLAAAHLVIARAGASSVTELQVAGRPAVLVPFYEPLTSIGRGDKGRGVGTHDYGLQLLKRGFALHGDDLICGEGFSGMADMLIKLCALAGGRVGEVPLVLRYDLKEGGSGMRIFRTIRGYLGVIGRHHRFARHARAVSEVRSEQPRA